MNDSLAKVLLYYHLIYDVQQLKQKIVCPLHQDANPSMIVDLVENRWFCFGCQQAGNALDLVKQIENKYNHLNDLQACKKYIKILKSDKYNDIKIREPPKKNENRKVTKQNYIVAYDYYHGLKKINWVCDSNVIKATKEYMLKRGFTVSCLNKAHAKVTYNYSYPIVFPISENGIFKGWVCRTDKAEVEKKRKYLYNTGFSRANTLAGNYKGYDIIYVVEGYMDMLKFKQYGIDNVVAILGWKMSRQQEEKLKNANVTIVVSALDNDECGRKGTVYLKSRFTNVVRWKYLKGIKDVGETTAETFYKMLNKTKQSF